MCTRRSRSSTSEDMSMICQNSSNRGLIRYINNRNGFDAVTTRYQTNVALNAKIKLNKLLPNINFANCWKLSKSPNISFANICCHMVVEQHSWDIVHFVQKVWNLAHSIYLPWSVFWDATDLTFHVIYSTILWSKYSSDLCPYLTYTTLNLFKLSVILIQETSWLLLQIHSMFHFKVMVFLMVAKSTAHAIALFIYSIFFICYSIIYFSLHYEHCRL